MKTTKWILAGALMSLGGAAFAGSGADCKDEHHAKREVKKDVDQVKSDVKDEGREVRASMSTDADKAESKIDNAADRAADKAEVVADKAEGRAEAVGNGLATSVREAKDAVKGEPSRLQQGQLGDGDMVRNTVTISPFAMLTGSGLNFLYSRPLSQKISGVAGGNFSRTTAADGAVTSLGVTAGADYYILGGNNEGLRVGPRLELGLGRDNIGANHGFGQFGAAGELGYNWISSKGLTAEAGLGLHGSVGASTQADQDRGMVAGNFGPYGKLGVGYSW